MNNQSLRVARLRARAPRALLTCAVVILCAAGLRAVIAGPPGREMRHVIEGHPPRFVSPLRSCVQCRGGEYLLVPSIAALRALPHL